MKTQDANPGVRVSPPAGGSTEPPRAFDDESQQPAGEAAPRDRDRLLALQAREAELVREVAELRAAVSAVTSSPAWRAIESMRRVGGRVRRARMTAVAWRAGGPGSRRLNVPQAVQRSPLGVNVAGNITAESGNGESTRASIRTLEAAGIPVALRDIPCDQRAGDSSFTRFNDDNPHPFNLVHQNADAMTAFARRVGRGYFAGRYTIGVWFWELARFRDDWRLAFRHVDEVWAASRFNERCYREVSPVPVVFMPHPVSEPRLAPVGRAHFGLPASAVVFLFVFDVASWIERKNPAAIIRAFRRAGFERGRARLVLKFSNGWKDRDGVRRLYEEADGADVTLLDGVMERGEVNALINCCDVYVSLHRAEGFGQTIAEAMLLGKPAIVTNYSGNVDFTTTRNSVPVGYQPVQIVRDHGPYLRGFEWADPSVDEAAAAMRLLADRPGLREEYGRRAADDVRARYNLASIGRRMADRLNAVRAGRVVPVEDLPW